MRDAAKLAYRPDTRMIHEMEGIAGELEEECCRRLADIFENDDWTSLLSWQDVREASRHPLVTFGSHTVDHIRLGLATTGEIRHQLQASKNAIERHTGSECRFFCFPSGSFSLECLSELQSSGYAAAVTTLEGLNALGDNPLTIRRVSFPMSDPRNEVLRLTIRRSQLAHLFSWAGGRRWSTECILGN
jgi:peptidoglycan/xylan/chitin deacetylase (PgdA/CDA1 family)